MTVKTSKGNITAPKDLLNTLTSSLYDASIYQAEKGYDILSSDTSKLANEIFESLAKTGYYDIVA